MIYKEFGLPPLLDVLSPVNPIIVDWGKGEHSQECSARREGEEGGDRPTQGKDTIPCWILRMSQSIQKMCFPPSLILRSTTMMGGLVGLRGQVVIVVEERTKSGEEKEFRTMEWRKRLYAIIIFFVFSSWGAEAGRGVKSSGEQKSRLGSVRLFLS